MASRPPQTRRRPAADRPSRLRKKSRRDPAAASTRGVEEHLNHVQRLVMQGELAATAVHEISNLLTIVLFNAGLLRQRHRDDPEEIKYIEPMLHAATLITTLCNQLRNLSRPVAAHARVIDLAETARSTFRLLEQVVTRELVFLETGDRPLLIFADSAQIDQTLVNLVLNARDATPDQGGRIVVRVGRGPRHTSYIEVEDNGTGMSAQVKKKLFTIFFTTKPLGQGTGLGLVTVRRLIEGMGGTIKLTSRPGRGTCIRLNFPRPDPAEVARYRAAGEPAPSEASDNFRVP